MVTCDTNCMCGLAQQFSLSSVSHHMVPGTSLMHVARLLPHNYWQTAWPTRPDAYRGIACKHASCGAHRVMRPSSVRCAMRRLRQPSGCACTAFLKCCCCTSSASSTPAPPGRSSPTMSPSQSRCATLSVCPMAGCLSVCHVSWLVHSTAWAIHTGVTAMSSFLAVIGSFIAMICLDMRIP